jgi:hypothetical protein
VLSKSKISAVLCSTDLARSQEFYEQKVGLTLSAKTIPNHLLFEGSDGRRCSSTDARVKARPATRRYGSGPATWSRTLRS